MAALEVTLHVFPLGLDLSKMVSTFKRKLPPGVEYTGAAIQRTYSHYFNGYYIYIYPQLTQRVGSKPKVVPEGSMGFRQKSEGSRIAGVHLEEGGPSARKPADLMDP